MTRIEIWLLRLRIGVLTEIKRVLEKGTRGSSPKYDRT